MIIRRLVPLALLPVATLALAGCPALHQAAMSGDTEAVIAMLDDGADPNQTADLEFSETALHRAFWNKPGYPETARALLDHGADPNAEKNNGSTPLCLAIYIECLEGVKLLIERGANINHACVADAIVSVQEENPASEVVRFILAAQADEPKRQLAAEREAARAARRAERRAARPGDPALASAEETAADTAARAGQQNEALAHYLAAVRACPTGTDTERQLREKVISFALTLTPPPTVPEEATTHSDRAQAFIERATDEAGFDRAVEELEQALQLAPWWPEAYFNLALVQEKLEDFPAAIASLKLYLLAAPGAPDAALVKKKIVDLEVAIELQAKQPAPPPPRPEPAPPRPSK